jgi:hypothetical protein
MGVPDLTNHALVAFEYNARDRAHFTQAFEFCSVVASCDAADLLAPEVDNAIAQRLGRFMPQHGGHDVQRDFNRLTKSIRKSLGLKNTPTVEPTEVTQDYELFFFAAWSQQSLVELRWIKNWRSRCKIAAAYVFQLWPNTLEQDRSYLKLLDQFDYVVLVHNKCMSYVASYTGTRCSVLPVGGIA